MNMHQSSLGPVSVGIVNTNAISDGRTLSWSVSTYLSQSEVGRKPRKTAGAVQCTEAPHDLSYLNDDRVDALRNGPFKEDALPFTWQEVNDRQNGSVFDTRRRDLFLLRFDNLVKEPPPMARENGLQFVRRGYVVAAPRFLAAITPGAGESHTGYLTKS